MKRHKIALLFALLFSALVVTAVSAPRLTHLPIHFNCADCYGGGNTGGGGVPFP